MCRVSIIDEPLIISPSSFSPRRRRGGENETQVTENPAMFFQFLYFSPLLFRIKIIILFV